MSSDLHWPLKDQQPLFPDAVGCFGVFRKNDRHAGVDLYCPLGTDVVAVEDGEVVVVEEFTGPKANSPWWNSTQAVLVEGASGVITYGEVTTFVKEGDIVKAGEVIARVDRTVLRSFKGRPMSMLHFEQMRHGSRDTLWWHLNEKQPEALLDPTDLLLAAAGGEPEFFRIEEYDGESFIDPMADRKASPWWAMWGGEL